MNGMTFPVFLAMELKLRKHLDIKQHPIDLEQVCKCFFGRLWEETGKKRE